MDTGCTELLLQLLTEALSLGPCVTFALAKLTVEHGFGHARVIHTRQTIGPTQLSGQE